MTVENASFLEGFHTPCRASHVRMSAERHRLETEALEPTKGLCQLHTYLAGSPLKLFEMAERYAETFRFHSMKVNRQQDMGARRAPSRLAWPMLCTRNRILDLAILCTDNAVENLNNTY